MKYLITLLSFVFVINTNSQTINGKVSDPQSKPIPFVSIHILNTGIYTASDATGQFKIRNLKSGNYIFQLTAIGYATKAIEITIDKRDVQSLEFTLQSSLRQLDAVTITAEKKEDFLQHVPSSITVL